MFSCNHLGKKNIPSRPPSSSVKRTTQAETIGFLLLLLLEIRKFWRALLFCQKKKGKEGMSDQNQPERGLLAQELLDQLAQLEREAAQVFPGEHDRCSYIAGSTGPSAVY